MEGFYVSIHMLPMVSNIATYNLHDGCLDAQVAPSVVKFNTIPRCQGVTVSRVHIETKSKNTDGTA
eukprot:2340864-Ditylum_brightwellii.AAC.1